MHRRSRQHLNVAFCPNTQQNRQNGTLLPFKEQEQSVFDVQPGFHHFLIVTVTNPLSCRSHPASLCQIWDGAPDLYTVEITSDISFRKQ